MATSASCAAKFSPAFIALNKIRKAADLCKLVKAAGLSFACNAPDLLDQIDRKALCELMCCCQAAAGPATPGTRRDFQGCVAATLMMADGANGYKGYYKAEVSYDKGGGPLMDAANSTRPQYFGKELMRLAGGPWVNYPYGSNRPDVVVLKDPSKPPTVDNVRKAYEMKFDYGNGASDQYGKEQKEAYEDLFQDKIDKEPLTPTNCKCKSDGSDESGKSVLEAAKAMQTTTENNISLVDQVNADTGKAVAAAALAVPATGAVGALGSAARVIGGLFGLAY